MKKLIMSVSILVILAGVSAPYLIGLRIEKLFYDQLSMVKKIPMQPGVKFSIDSYQRGYLSSTAIASMTIDMPAGKNMPTASRPLKLTMKHVISHGPVIADSPSVLSMAKMVSTIVLNDDLSEIEHFYFGEQPFLSATSYVGFDGSSTMNVTIPPYDGPSHTGNANIKWAGLTAVSKGNWMAIAGTGKLSAPSLEITGSNGMRFVMNGIHGDGDTKISPQGLGLGAVNMAITDFGMTVGEVGGDQRKLEIDNMKFHVDIGQTENLVNAAEEFGFDKVTSDSNVYENGVIRFEVKNLDAGTLQSIQKKVAAIFEAMPANPDPAMIQNAYQSVWLEVLPDLLKYSPEVLISKAGVNLDEGPVSGRLRVAIHDGDKFDMRMGLPALIPLLIVEVDLRAPVATVTRMARSVMQNRIRSQLAANKQTMNDSDIETHAGNVVEQVITHSLQQNIIRREDASFTVKARFTNGHLFLNDQPADGLLGQL